MLNDLVKYPPQSSDVKGWDHQVAEVERTWNKKYWGLFWEMGCGKTKPLIDTFLRLFYAQEIDGVIIISDKGCYLNWPNDQFPKHIPQGTPMRVGIWSSQNNQHERSQLDRLLRPKDDLLDILVVNVEAFSSDRAPEFVEAFIRTHYAMMIVDESTSIKSPKASRTKTIKELGKLCEYRRVATGTPITQSPLDLYSQADFLSPGLLGFTSHTAFKAHFAQTKRITVGRQQFDKVVGYRNIDQLQVMLKGFSSRILKTDCLDLPDKVYETVYVEQTPEQERAYQQLLDESIVQFDSGILTVTSALTAIMKLHQINCGHLRMDEHVEKMIPSNRMGIVEDLIEKILPGKVIIWGHYQKDMDIIGQYLSEKYGWDRAVPYHGRVDDDDRKKSLDRFINDSNCWFLYGTPACGGKGINGLTVCSNVIYYSNGYNLERRLQSEDRTHRPGQTCKVTYYDLVCPKTVDEKIVKSLLAKKDLAAEVLDTFREMLT